jgi:hypothetical protein
MKKIYILFVFAFCVHATHSQTLGLLLQNPGSLDGYVLFSPIPSNNTYLIDKCGKLVHSWTSTHHPGQSVYLLPDGNLLRTGSTNNAVFTSGGNGGIIEKFDWSSSVQWAYTISSSTECQHHDIHPMPNGNVLAIVWESKSSAEAIAAGRNPTTLGTSLWSEKIVELQPTGPTTANIVWEWHVWDHLIQQFDATKANYGTVSSHPELIHLNFTSGAGTNADWLHCNSIDYNPSLDQIILSSHNFNEVWIIDHSTTTTEAASHAGGVRGHGGDLLYRWGNPLAYNRGIASDKKLFGQHNAHWIDSTLRDAGKIMIFNNGQGRPTGNYSSVDVVNPVVDSSGDYVIDSTSNVYLPDSAEWTYTAPVHSDFYSTNISGAQRLSNGNTIICEGPQGTFFEIDSAKNVVWKYVNPVAQSGILSQGTTPTMNLVFRCTLYEPSFSGFAGQTLTPGNPIELNPLPYVCSMITSIPQTSSTEKFHAINPFAGKIIFYTDETMPDADAELMDVSRRILGSWNHLNIESQTSVTLNITREISPGIYSLKIKSTSKTIVTKLIHIQ